MADKAAHHTVMSTLRDRVLQAIELTGMKKAEVARALGVTPQSVNGWLKNGRISKRSLSDLAQLAGVPVIAILDGPMPARPLPIGVRELVPVNYRALPPEEIELLELYRACDERTREMLRTSARALADTAALRVSRARRASK